MSQAGLLFSLMINRVVRPGGTHGQIIVNIYFYSNNGMAGNFHVIFYYATYFLRIHDLLLKRITLIMTHFKF